MSTDRPLPCPRTRARVAPCRRCGLPFLACDEAEMCASWARMGECSKNPLFMHRSAYTGWFDFPGP
eukprot:scaffold52728_cov69-Phaeocystis_antarctica.AAC.12